MAWGSLLLEPLNPGRSAEIRRALTLVSDRASLRLLGPARNEKPETNRQKQNPMNFDTELDARDLKCPLPVLKTRKAMKPLTAGQVLKVVTTDPKSPSDLAAFIETTGHELLGCQISAAPFEFYIKKAAL